MPTLALAAIELAITVISQAIAAGKITPEEVQQRITNSKSAADAAEQRVDERLERPPVTG
jgi:hypothetical protein